MVDFTSILNKRGDDVKPPAPLPTGHYVFVARSWDLQEPRQEGQNACINFVLNALQPAGDDVDMEVLSQRENWQQRNIRLTFWLTEDAAFRLSKFATEACRVDPSLTLGEMPPLCLNIPFVAEVRHRPRKDSPEIFDEDLRGFAPAE